MSHDEDGRPVRLPKPGFDAVQALLHTTVLNADKTRRVPALQAIFEGQLQRALAGDSRAAASIIAFAVRYDIWHEERPSNHSLYDFSNLTDEERKALSAIANKAMRRTQPEPSHLMSTD